MQQFQEQLFVTVEDPVLSGTCEEPVQEAEKPRCAVPEPAIVTSQLISNTRDFTVKNADEIAPDASYGEVLKALRLASGCSIEELADETRIKTMCLKALEEENLDDLPQEVYVIAYVKKLCMLYGMGDRRIAELTASLRQQLKRELPEDISRNLCGHSVSDDNDRHVRRLAITLITIAIILLLVVIGAVILAVNTFFNGSSSGAIKVEFNEHQVVKLQGDPELDLTILPDK